MFRRIKGRLYRALHYDWLSWSRKHCYLYKKIFGEKYSQNYCLKVLYCPDTLIFSEHGYSNTDFNTEHVNVVGGKRLTVGSNNSSSMKIHCFGDSRLYGVGVEDADTFCSLLQKKINERKESATVVNHGILNSCFSNIYNELINTNIQEGDCVFIFLPPQFIHYELYGIPLAASFRMMKKYGTIVAKNIQKFCIDRDVDVFFLKWPDVRLLKFPSRHDRLMQRLVSNVFLKQYVFIPDSEEIDPYLTRKKADMRFIQLDLTDAFNESSDGKDLFWDSSHFGPLGHKIIADRLYAFFEKNLFEKKNKTRFQVQSATPSPWVLASSKKTS